MTKGRKTGGKVKGSVNKRTKEIQQMLDDLDCNPLEGMVEIANRAKEGVLIGVDDDGNQIMKPDLVLAGNMYKELAQYIAPKRKAIEHTGRIDGDHEHDHRFEIVFVEPKAES